jgi:heme/copper-type cytochrome/quinol oxidase subunit 2
MQLLQSIFIGWIILLSRVSALYSAIAGQIKTQNRHKSWCTMHPARANTASHRMKPATIIGLILIVLGIVGFVTGGVSFTHQKKDVDIGPVQISHESKQTVPISPILSGIALVAGIGLVVVGSKG